MNRIVFRFICGIVTALPVWIILHNLWVGIFVMFLTYMIIHFIQFLTGVKITALYDYFSQFYVDAETGKKIDIESLRKYVENDNAYNRKFQKAFKNYL